MREARFIWNVSVRVASMLGRLGRRGGRVGSFLGLLEGVLGAFWGRLERFWGGYSASPKRQKPCVLRVFLTFSDWDTCIHAGGCGSGVCVQCGSLGKHVVKVFRTPEDDAGGPKRPLGTFLGRLGGG